MLVWDGANWVPGDVCTIIDDCSIDALGDADTTTDPPNVGEGLVWDGTNWVPGPVGAVSSIVQGPDTGAGSETLIHNDGLGNLTTICQGFNLISFSDPCPVAFDDTRRLVNNVDFLGKTFSMDRVPDHTSIGARTELGALTIWSEPGSVVAGLPLPPSNGVLTLLQQDNGLLTLNNPSSCREMCVEVSVQARIRMDGYDPPRIPTDAFALLEARVNGGAWTFVKSANIVQQVDGASNSLSGPSEVNGGILKVTIPAAGAAVIDTRLQYLGQAGQNSIQSIWFNVPGVTATGYTI